MYNFVNCLQFNIRYEKVEHPAPVGGALVLLAIVLSVPLQFMASDYPFSIIKPFLHVATICCIDLTIIIVFFSINYIDTSSNSSILSMQYEIYSFITLLNLNDLKLYKMFYIDLIFKEPAMFAFSDIA